MKRHSESYKSHDDMKYTLRKKKSKKNQENFNRKDGNRTIRIEDYKRKGKGRT